MSSETLTVDNSAAPIQLSVAGGTEPDSLAGRLRWMASDRDRYRDRVDELLAEVGKLTEQRDSYRKECHDLRTQLNQVTIQSRLDRMMARSHPEAPEGGHR